MDAYKQKYQLWIDKATDPEIQRSLREMTEEDVKNAFSSDLSFGTGGLRGVMSAGTDRMNVYTVYRATEGLARYMQKHGLTRCAVTYDSRLNSKLFCRIAAATLARNGMTVYITKECMPTPFLSFAVRHLKCDVGVNVTASHNPAIYNGYKVYQRDGCQLTDKDALEVTGFINGVDVFERPLPNFDDYENKTVKYMDGEAERAYEQAVMRESLASADGLKIAYTPLNGAGHRLVPEVLRKAGAAEVNVVEEQSYPDGRFETCPYPNPEKAEALKLAIELAEKTCSDIVIATDPDSDRLGVAVRHDDKYVQLSGNEVGVLLEDYVLGKRKANGTLPKRAQVVKTIVTSPMVDAVAHEYGAEVVDVLTGFKYIGDVINKLESNGQVNRYVFGFEESCGYLKGTYVRDKDGVVASLLIAECAAECKKQGKTLIDKLNEMYLHYGNYLLKTVSYRFEGADGAEKKRQLLLQLRKKPLAKVGDSAITSSCDFLTQKEYDLPKSDVMRYDSADGSRLIIRPSGTEPLIKCYMSVKGDAKLNESKIETIQKQLDALFK